MSAFVITRLNNYHIKMIIDWFESQDTKNFTSLIFLHGMCCSTELELNKEVKITFNNSYERKKIQTVLNNSDNIKSIFIELFDTHPNLNNNNNYLKKTKRKFIETLFLFKYTNLEKELITDVYKVIKQFVVSIMCDVMTDIPLFLEKYLEEMVL